MVRVPKYHTLLIIKNRLKAPKRNISKYIDQEKTSKSIRQCFLDYFINDANHTFVRSSPVIPYCDPTVAFVNAGMNQFKGVFLGTQVPRYRTVANSQKCVRVGGKHNDLNAVGLDGYHHTFFEMLGNWSFGDYFKKEACQMAWNLLTRRLNINKNILYVTYFGGDEKLGLEADLECKDIWKSIGVSEDRIVPFGMRDNFWEMGATGPCGPCTEIHVDLLGAINRSNFINKGLPDLTELWNIVFIQYNRTADGSVQNLPQKHIDTGMGFERLTALIQGKLSNYDTDIFSNIFSGIAKECKGISNYEGKYGEKDWNGLDTNYRILADHVRMIAVCLADGVIPEQNQKLRRIIRRSFQISDGTFKKESGLLKLLSNYVVENLGSTYPELEKNIKQIQQIIDYEEEVYRSLRASSAMEWEKLIENEPRLSGLDVIEMPGLLAAYKEIRNLPNNTITADFGFKLYDTFGLDERTIKKVAQALNLLFDVEGFKSELENAKKRSRGQILVNADTIYEQLKNNNVKTTDDSFKYNYKKENGIYVYIDLGVEVIKIIHNNVFVEKIEPNNYYSIILNKTNLYSEAGGQISDKGLIKLKDCRFIIEKTSNLNGFILHHGALDSKYSNTIQVGARGTLEIDKNLRLSVMRNHSATHLLNATLKQLKGATCQKSSKATENYLNFDVGIFGSKLTIEDVQKLEEKINGVIKQNADVKILEIDSQTLLDMNNVILIPGEIYPDIGIRLIEIKGPDDFLSREPCCGTHVNNTGDIEDFCIIRIRSLGRSTTSLHAVTGERAKLARRNGSELLDSVAALQQSVNDNIDKPEILHMAVGNLRKNLKYDLESSAILPVIVKFQASKLLKDINKQIKDIAKGTLREFIEMEMEHVLHLYKTKKSKYIVHYLACSTMLDVVPLQKATRLCEDIPVIVISYSENTVTARCCVPKHVKNPRFTAEIWLSSTVCAIFDTAPQIFKGQDSTLVCNMKSKRINIKDWHILLQQSIEAAKKYADEYMG